MKTTVVQNPKLSGSRRSFLKSAGLLACSAPAAMAVPFGSVSGAPQLCRAQVVAEGLVPVIPVQPPIPWVLPPLDGNPYTPEIDPLPLPPNAQVRLRVTFPVRDRSVLAIQLYMLMVEDPASPPPLPLPQPPPPILPEPNPTMAYLEVGVKWIEVGYRPQPTIAFTGKVILHNPQFPGFGNQLGATAVVTAGFALVDGGATFTMLAANVAGNHVTVAPQAVGKLVL